MTNKWRNADPALGVVFSGDLASYDFEAADTLRVFSDPPPWWFSREEPGPILARLLESGNSVRREPSGSSRLPRPGVLLLCPGFEATLYERAHELEVLCLFVEPADPSVFYGTPAGTGRRSG